jgi:uncharacterized protein (DUF697 family)
VVLPLHVTMVIGVGEVYGCALEREGALELVSRIGGAVGLSWVGSRAATTLGKLLLPGVGGLAGAALVYASTLALGGVAIAFFERGGALDEAEIRRVYAEKLSFARGRYDPRRREPAPPVDDAWFAEVVARLTKLDRLLEAGLITDEDHAATRARILGEVATS